jgi:hypothetical protein
MLSASPPLSAAGAPPTHASSFQHLLMSDWLVWGLCRQKPGFRGSEVMLMPGALQFVVATLHTWQALSALPYCPRAQQKLRTGGRAQGRRRSAHGAGVRAARD